MQAGEGPAQPTSRQGVDSTGGEIQHVIACHAGREPA